MYSLFEFLPSLLNNLLIILGCGFLLLLIALKFVPVLRRCVFPICYFRFSTPLYENIDRERSDMLSDLANTKSFDEKLRAQGSIRILEVGTGPGVNFDFYPDNSHLILVEPNEFFLKQLTDNCLKHPKLHVEKLIKGAGEHMTKIEDNSVDAVVATHVLCSVDDVRVVLKEIHRVLVPGGKYYFMEHGYGVRPSWIWAFQHVVNPFWKLFTNGCQIIKDTLQDIKQCGLFVNVHSETFYPPPITNPFMRVCWGTNVYGSAQKPVKDQY